MSNIRETSNKYWAERNPKKCFIIFLISLKKRDDIPWIPKDIRKLLFQYMTNFIQFHNNKIGNMNPYDDINSNIRKLKQKLSRVDELVLVEPINYIIHANTMQCSHISATRFGRETVHVKMAFTIQDCKVSNDLFNLENRIQTSIGELFKNNVMYRPIIKRFDLKEKQNEKQNVLFFAKHMKMDNLPYNLKQYYDNPYTNIDYFHFDKSHYVYVGLYDEIKTRLQEWKRVDIKDWVKFDFVMKIYSVSKTNKSWSIRYKFEPKLPFWLEVD